MVHIYHHDRLPITFDVVSDCIISLILIIQLVKFDVTSRDITWNLAGGGLWSAVEQNLGIISGAFPTLPSNTSTGAQPILPSVHRYCLKQEP